MRKAALVLFILITQSLFSQSRHELDSLLSILKKSVTADTNLALTYNEIGYAYSRINIDSAKIFANKALSLSSKLNYKNGIASAYNTLGIHYHMLSQFENALTYYQKSKSIKEALGDKKGVASSQNNMGIILYLQGNYDKALETFNASLKIQEAIRDTAGMPNTLNYMASVNYFLANYERSLGFYLKSLNLYEKTNNKPGLCQAYNNLGTIYSALKNLDQAALNYNKSLELAEETGDKYFVISSYNNLGTVFQEKKEFAKALEYFSKSLELSRELRNTEGIAVNLEKTGSVLQEQGKLEDALKKYKEALVLNEKAGQAFNVANILNAIGSVYDNLNRNADALSYYSRSLKAAQQLNSKSLIAEVSLNYAKLLRKTENYKKSYYYWRQYSSIRDSILSDEKNKSMAEMQTRFDIDSKEKEISLLTKSKSVEELKLGEQKENIEKQRVTIYASVFGIILMLALAFFVLKSYREKKKTNALLEEKNFSISQQKQILEEKNKLITDSIEYAKNIQDIILPDNKLFKELFPESFVLFIPKDVVSGDFFWLLNSGDKNESILAAIDCVGHGVPGAFMALHCYNLLERIVKENKGISPANILDKLNEAVIKSLHQNNENTSSKHGMDLAMVKIRENEIEFAGARNSLVIVNPKGEMQEIKADRMFVGGALGNFTNTKAKPEPGSMIYMFTDGYPDQKGGVENKKYFITVFKQLLVSLADRSTNEQHKILYKTFVDWKGSNEQMDDILVIGIRV